MANSTATCLLMAQQRGAWSYFESQDSNQRLKLFCRSRHKWHNEGYDANCKIKTKTRPSAALFSLLHYYPVHFMQS